MNERPILFSGPMVRAILEGRKTQTRRVVKNLEMFGDEHDDGTVDLADVEVHWTETGHSGPGYYAWCGEYPDEGSEIIKCPHGTVGDRLWVRESFRLSTGSQGDHNGVVTFRDGASKIIYWQDGHRIHDRYGFIEKDSPKAMRPRPSIHMPRWASRITLEITGIRVERVKEISVKDAIAEGIKQVGQPYIARNTWVLRDFRDLWDSINASRGFGWDSNPWVWVIEFKRVGGDK